MCCQRQGGYGGRKDGEETPLALLRFDVVRLSANEIVSTFQFSSEGKREVEPVGSEKWVARTERWHGKYLWNNSTNDIAVSSSTPFLSHLCFIKNIQDLNIEFPHPFLANIDCTSKINRWELFPIVCQYKKEQHDGGSEGRVSKSWNNESEIYCHLRFSSANESKKNVKNVFCLMIFLLLLVPDLISAEMGKWEIDAIHLPDQLTDELMTHQNSTLNVAQDEDVD